MYENKDYEKGTYQLLESLIKCGADVYIGGGDTVSAINKLGFKDKFKYVSSGGGATLEYVAYGELKAIKWIEENGLK